MKPFRTTKLVDALVNASVGRQGQLAVDGGSHAGLTARWVVMPAAHNSGMHRHKQSPISVSVVSGHAATVMLTPEDNIVIERHRPGDVIILEPGVSHAAINLSRTEPVVASEVGGSSGFASDVDPRDEWADTVTQLGAALRDEIVPDGDLPRTVADILLSRLLPREPVRELGV